MKRVEAPLWLKGVHLQPYNEIIRPGQVWKISKYFLRRWTPYLPPSSVWLVIGARQESYFNGNRPWFTAYDANLAAAAGVHVRSFRRSAKKEIAEGRGALATFIHKTGDPAYVRGQPVPKQEQTRYEIRLDDPLAPADAAHLAFWLRRRAPQQATVGTVTGLLETAREAAPPALRAQEIEPDGAESTLLTVADVVAHVFPGVAGEGGWREAADRLHTHIVEPQLFHLESQYLRRRWLDELGPGPALLFVYLRSLCYHNPQTGEIRDEAAVRSGMLEALFQKSSVTLRAWFRRLEELLGESHTHGPFLEAVSSRKLPTQQVETVYRLNLLTPLHPDDLPRYRELVAGQGDGGGGPAPATGPGREETIRPRQREQGEGAPPSAAGTEKGVSKDLSATPEGGHQRFVSHAEEGEVTFVSHVGKGHESSGSHADRGGASFGSRWAKKWQPYKYYKYFLAQLEPEFRTLFLERTQQQQHPWKLDGNCARQTFAAAAVSSRGGLLDHFGVEGVTRNRILQAGLGVEALVAWYLYAEREAGLVQPARFMMKQAVAGEKPPAQFLQLAHLSWEQWRTYTASCYLGPWLDPALQEASAHWPRFTEWRALYGAEEPAKLPFGVGEGLTELAVAFQTAPGLQATDDRPERAELGGDRGAEQWRSALQELAQQMTRATYSARLRDARFLEREGETFVIGVRDEEARAWLINRMRPVVERTLAVVVGHEVSVRFVAAPGDGYYSHSHKQ